MVNFSVYPIKYQSKELNAAILDHAWSIIEELGKELLKKIQKRTIRKLQSYKKDVLILGDDTGLKNLWDEYCAQLQSEMGHLFEMQENLIYDEVSEQIDILKTKNKNDFKILSLYISTCYCEELYEGMLSNGEITDKISNTMKQIAVNYSNNAINNYVFN